MENGIPEGVRSDIRAAVAPILEAAREAGWSFGAIQSKGSHAIELNAKSPTGAAVHASWGENDFPERLRTLLNSH
jgi:hypothetical protein